MTRFTSRFLILILTFFVGIAIVSWSAPGVSQTIPPKFSAKKPSIFKPLPRYHYFRFWAQDYELPDGRIISIECQNLDTPLEANKRLNLKINYAQTILERNLILDANERRIGERIVAAFPPVKRQLDL